eukprot:6190612-Pleurochrysis_carterae.AAC.1
MRLHIHRFAYVRKLASPHAARSCTRSIRCRLHAHIVSQQKLSPPSAHPYTHLLYCYAHVSRNSFISRPFALRRCSSQPSLQNMEQLRKVEVTEIRSLPSGQARCFGVCAQGEDGTLGTGERSSVTKPRLVEALLRHPISKLACRGERSPDARMAVMATVEGTVEV